MRALAGKGDERVKADEGVTPPFFAALHGLEQEDLLAVFRDFGKEAERRIQIGQHRAVHRHEIVVLKRRGKGSGIGQDGGKGAGHWCWPG